MPLSAGKGKKKSSLIQGAAAGEPSQAPPPPCEEPSQPRAGQGKCKMQQNAAVLHGCSLWHLWQPPPGGRSSLGRSCSRWDLQNSPRSHICSSQACTFAKQSGGGGRAQPPLSSRDPRGCSKSPIPGLDAAQGFL